MLAVGFETSMVQIREDAGMAEVKVELNDTTEVPVTLLFTSTGDTATGTATRPTYITTDRIYYSINLLCFSWKRLFSSVRVPGLSPWPV